MIVIARKVGALGNQLALFAHAIAAARELGVPVCNPAFFQNAEFFQGTRNDLWCRYGTSAANDEDRRPPQWTRRLLYHLTYLTARIVSFVGSSLGPLSVIRLRNTEGYDLASSDFAHRVSRHSCVLLQGWLFRCHDLVFRHGDAIRDFFQLTAEHRQNVTRVVAAARAPGELLVGLHCRQGDYRTAFDGRFFYTAEQYRAIARRIERHFAPQPVRFLVCGNEPDQFRQLAAANVAFGSGHFVEDLYALAECDFLVGPPSTYTIWASFFGRKPLCGLDSAEASIRFTASNYQASPRVEAA